MKNAVLFFAVLLAASPCVARIITVDANGTGDYPTIQAAIDNANNGDTVQLLRGRYTGPGNRDIDFKGKVNSKADCPSKSYNVDLAVHVIKADKSTLEEIVVKGTDRLFMVGPMVAHFLCLTTSQSLIE